MKNLYIILVSLSLNLANAQIPVFDATTPHTNTVVVPLAQLTVYGVFTNQAYSATNTNYISLGDSWPTAASKLNSAFAYCTNQFASFAFLPYQINTNIYAYGAGLSNYMTTLAVGIAGTNWWLVNHACTNFGSGYSFTNLWLSGDATAALINGTNLASQTVNSNAFDADTLTWLQACLVAGAHMSFDADASTPIASDGSGNLTATTVKSGLRDASNNSGPAGYTPIADGSGGWNWTPTEVIPDTTGYGGTCLHLKASDTGGDLYLHVDSSGVITATISP